jgi:hypothetical protein
MRVRILTMFIIAVMVMGPSSAAAFETTPEDGETGFPIDGEIIIEFDERMDTESVNVHFTPELTYPIQTTWSDNDRVLTLSPTVELLPHRNYGVVVSGENMSGHQVWESFSFETGFHPEEDRRPYISSLIIPIFIIIAIVAIMAVYITMKGIRQKKGQ